MDKRTLTKEDLDKVRDIEGFPIGSDEDIISLSEPPYYTSCPNPFIGDYISENGKVYDEETDVYHRKPYTADVSEGKHDPLYMAHSYHTKVPYKAIMRYILHYTNPGDIVFDGFCGTGMTAVAAQLCKDRKTCREIGITDENTIGFRNAIVSDLSPEAAFIAHNYTNKIDIQQFHDVAEQIIQECKKECGWVYETIGNSKSVGTINYTIWSEVYICPQCSKEIVYWEAAVDEENEKSKKKPVCTHCGAELAKANCEKVMTAVWDEQSDEVSSQPKSVPIRINYDLNGKRCIKKPDEKDFEIIKRIEDMKIGYWYPSNLMMNKGAAWGDQWRAGYHVGMTRVNHFYFKRNLYVLAKCYDSIEKVNDESIKSLLKFWMSSIYSRSHKLNRYMP